MEDGEVILQKLLEDEPPPRMGAKTAPAAQPEDEKEKGKQDKETHSQWALGGNGRFMPVGHTTALLPPGVYETFATPGMWGVERIDVASDGIYTLPDMATDVVLEEAKKFWTSEVKYRAHGLLYKRGILLWGPPGGGKTVAVKLLMNELVRKDGVVVIISNVQLAVMVLKAVRRIEAKRNLIVVMEDIDEIINYNGEATVLSMLDGENNIDNILHLATTNYPERLGARIINRPSRFDRRVYVGMPSPIAREVYLKKSTNDGLDAKELKRWTKDTDGMSIAHLRELVAAVYCLEQPYVEVIGRLKDMAMAVKGEDGFKRNNPGFLNRAVKGTLYAPDDGAETATG